MALSHSHTRVPVADSIPGPGSYMCGLTWDGALLWHSDQDAGKLFGLDPSTGAVVRTVACAQARADVAYHSGMLWQIGGRPKRLLLIDPLIGREIGQRPVRPPSGRVCGVEAGPEGMWMCLRGPSVVQLRDYDTMTVQREFPVDGHPSGLTYVDGVIVFSEFEAGTIRTVDAGTGEMLGVATVEGHPTGMTWDGQFVWYCDFEARRLKALRPTDLPLVRSAR